MIRLEKNRVYYGHSNADMINRVLGTSWSKYYKSKNNWPLGQGFKR